MNTIKKFVVYCVNCIKQLIAMAKHKFIGTFICDHHKPPPKNNFNNIRKMLLDFIWTAFGAMAGNYVAVASVLFVAGLSFLIPDISQKIHSKSELNEIKKVLSVVSKEVNRAKMNFQITAEGICTLHCHVQGNLADSFRETPEQIFCQSSSHIFRLTQSDSTLTDRKQIFTNKVFVPHRNVSNKEITIMSYTYTDSFEDQQANYCREIDIV